MSPGRGRWWLLGIGAVVLVLIAVGVVALVSNLPRHPVDLEDEFVAGQVVGVELDNGAVEVVPSEDERVRVRLDGYAVVTPRLLVEADGRGSTVRIACPTP